MTATSETMPRARMGCDRCVGILVDGPEGPHHKSCGCPCTLDGCAHAAPWAVQQWVTEQQRRLGYVSAAGRPWWDPRRRPDLLRRELRRLARWWELESMRGYPSSERTREYAANQRWLVELLDNGVDVCRPFAELLKERRRPSPKLDTRLTPGDHSDRVVVRESR